MNKIKLYISISVILLSCQFLLLSCTERMDINTDKNIPRLVITGAITTDTTTQYVHVTQSVQYIGNEETKYYLDGIVKINDEELVVDYQKKAYATPANFYGKPGETYTLDVWVDFDEDGVKEHYTARTTMPQRVDLDSIYLGSMSITNPLGPAWMLFACFQDPIGPGYFGNHISLNNYPYSDDLANYGVEEDKPGSDSDGRYIKNPVFYIDKEMPIDEDNDYILHPGDTLTYAMHHLSKEYFTFVNAARKEVEGTNPLFAGPPANIPSNISNGALGFFGAYTISRKQIILPTTPTFTE